jgi:hypothetical protein
MPCASASASSSSSARSAAAFALGQPSRSGTTQKAFVRNTQASASQACAGANSGSSAIGRSKDASALRIDSAVNRLAW